MRLVRMRRGIDLLERRLRRDYESLSTCHIRATGPREFHISLIIVSRLKREKGVGSAIMRDILKFADRHRSRITLHVAKKTDAVGATSEARLIGFYQRFGFTVTCSTSEHECGQGLRTKMMRQSR